MADTGDAGVNFDDIGRFTLSVPAGDFIFREGEAGAELFVVLSGRVELLAGPDGRRLASLEPGGVFGELSFFESRPREVSARAGADSRVIRLDRAAFDRVTTEAPQLAVSMLQQLSRRAGEERATLRKTRQARPSASGSAKAPAPSAAVPAGSSPMLVEAASGREFPLADLAEALVGRRDRASGFVPEVDLTTLDTERTLSRRHARLVKRDDTWCVREEASTRNGTFVNGERIAAGVERALTNGDQVQFGLVKTVFQWR